MAGQNVGIGSQRIARLSVDSRLPDSLKGPKVAQGLKEDSWETLLAVLWALYPVCCYVR